MPSTCWHKVARGEKVAVVFVRQRFVLEHVLAGGAILRDPETQQLRVCKQVLAGSDSKVDRGPVLFLHKGGEGGVPSGTDHLKQLVLAEFSGLGITSDRFQPCIRGGLSKSRGHRYRDAARTDNGAPVVFDAQTGSPCLPPASAMPLRLDIQVDFYCSALLHGCKCALRVGFMYAHLVAPVVLDGDAWVPLIAMGAEGQLKAHSKHQGCYEPKSKLANHGEVRLPDCSLASEGGAHRSGIRYGKAGSVAVAELVEKVAEAGLHMLSPSQLLERMLPDLEGGGADTGAAAGALVTHLEQCRKAKARHLNKFWHVPGPEAAALLTIQRMQAEAERAARTKPWRPPATTDEVKLGKVLYTSMYSICMSPLCILFLREGNLKQMIEERKRGIGHSMDFTRLPLTYEHSGKHVQVLVMTTRNVHDIEHDRTGSQPLINALCIMDESRASQITHVLEQIEDAISRLLGGAQPPRLPWMVTDCCRTELKAEVRAYCRQYASVSSYILDVERRIMTGILTGKPVADKDLPTAFFWDHSHSGNAVYLHGKKMTGTYRSFLSWFGYRLVVDIRAADNLLRAP